MTDLGIRHGIYTYLEKLGCHWLFPNEHWTILPKRDSIRLTLDETDAPVFRVRDFFGSGGFGGKLPVDPEMALQKRWELWKLRNRIGGDLRIGGHSGEGFNIAHRKILEEHPEYLAEVGGKRQPWSMITKPCYSNPEWRKLYIQDRLTNFKRTYDQDPASKNAVAVSVEPADGGGNCECANCLALGSFSDRVFGLANETAIALRQQYPDRFVSLLAYNEHAAPPKFELEPNVIVLSTPYAFQRTGLPGDELVKAWSAKAKTLGIYDYWSIPDWSNNLPDLSYSRTVPRKIRFWHEQGARIYLSESNFGAGNVGLVQYLASRIMWNPAVDEKKLADEFFQLAFGPAEPPMRRMISRWDRLVPAHGTRAGSLRSGIWRKRARLATDPAIRARVEDYAPLRAIPSRLWQAYTVAPRESDARKAATRKLVDWLLADLSHRDGALVPHVPAPLPRYEGKDTALLEEWPLKNVEAPIWQTYKAGVSPDEIGKLIADGKRGVHAPGFPGARLSRRPRAAGQKPATLSEKTVDTPIFVGDHEFEFWAPRRIGDVGNCQSACNLRENYPGNLVTVTAPDGSTIYRSECHPTASGRSGEAGTEGGGELSHDGWRIRRSSTRYATGQSAVRDPRLERLYRAAVQGVFLRAEGSGRPGDPLGERGASESAGWLRRHRGARPRGALHRASRGGAAGRVWSVADFKAYSPMRLLNAPPYFAFSPEGMMLPAVDALTAAPMGQIGQFYRGTTNPAPPDDAPPGPGEYPPVPCRTTPVAPPRG